MGLVELLSSVLVAVGISIGHGVQAGTKYGFDLVVQLRQPILDIQKKRARSALTYMARLGQNPHAWPDRARGAMPALLSIFEAMCKAVLAHDVFVELTSASIGSVELADLARLPSMMSTLARELADLPVSPTYATQLPALLEQWDKLKVEYDLAGVEQHMVRHGRGISELEADRVVTKKMENLDPRCFTVPQRLKSQDDSATGHAASSSKNTSTCCIDDNDTGSNSISTGDDLQVQSPDELSTWYDSGTDLSVKQLTTWYESGASSSFKCFDYSQQDSHDCCSPDLYLGFELVCGAEVAVYSCCLKQWFEDGMLHEITPTDVIVIYNAGRCRKQVSRKDVECMRRTLSPRLSRSVAQPLPVE